MRNLFVFESGSTKTTVLISPIVQTNSFNQEQAPTEIKLSGYNPNRDSTSFLTELKKLEISSKDIVVFYGSGLAAAENKSKIKKTFQNYFKNNITVFDDILGAARALYENKPGILAILGTGGIVAKYNGQIITERKGGYGYLIDDLGGGYELGKLIISNWLNNDLPQTIDHDLSTFLKINKSDFIKEYYSNSNLAYHKNGLAMIANTVKFIAKYKTNSNVKKIILNYFILFFRRNILPICTNNNNKEVRLCGSLAKEFEDILKEIGEQYNIKISKIIQYPVNELLSYHRLKIAEN